MLTRLYVDNYRCFVNFEYCPERKQLILGSNGTGKSSLLDALLFVRQFATVGERAHPGMLIHWTRWQTRPEQTFEIEAVLDDQTFRYRLVLEPWGDPPLPRVVLETVHCDDKPIFEFKTGNVRLYDDQFTSKTTYSLDWHRSALATIQPSKTDQMLTRFRVWLAGLFCFRLNPFAMTIRAEKEDAAPNADLSNFAAWYRHLVLADPEQNSEMITRLKEVLDGFTFLKLDPAGENVRLLFAEFEDGDGSRVRLGFNELSDGQRCLICLYAILEFLVARGQTVILDEPDNFVSLREIQPWLMAVTDYVEEERGQVLVISHHPEVIDQWAPRSGVQFYRDRCGPVRIKEFRGDIGGGLSASESVARGWEHE